MLTQTVPAVINALQGVLPDNAVKALTQALGNCNQPLAHRGAVSFSPPPLPEAGPGFSGGGRWNPADYPGLFPDMNSANNVDMPGWGGPWGFNSTNYYGDTFNFPTNQQFTLNNYNGGPNIYNAGDQYTENMFSNSFTTNNVITNNINTTTINGEPIAGPAGPAGADGEPGAPGAPGRPGPLGPRNFRFIPKFGPIGPFLGPGAVADLGGIGATVRVSIPTTGTVDPDDCTVSLGGEVEREFPVQLAVANAPIVGPPAGLIFVLVGGQVQAIG